MWALGERVMSMIAVVDSGMSPWYEKQRLIMQSLVHVLKQSFGDKELLHIVNVVAILHHLWLLK